MEFTFQGLVRYGFGFQNPNCAAAFIVVLQPLIWSAMQTTRRLWLKILFGILSALLCGAMALTFSRAGIIVLVLEMAWFFAPEWKKCWKVAAALLLTLATALIVSGALLRFIPDRAMSNRVLIYTAGLKLAAANPLGVGSGNAGTVASAFLLPPGIDCYTLVNSHLTLLAEYGMIAGFVYFFLIGYALSAAKNRTARIALAGVLLCACLSPVFDWRVLKDPYDFAGTGMANFIALWLLAGVSLAIFVRLFCAPFALKRVWIAGGTGVGVLLFTFCFFRHDTPRVRDNCVYKGDGQSTLVLNDAWTPLREVVAILPQDYKLPLRPWLLDAPPPPAPTVILVGDMRRWRNLYPNSTLVFIPEQADESAEEK